jgi:hypothetical protein
MHIRSAATVSGLKISLAYATFIRSKLVGSTSLLVRYQHNANRSYIVFVNSNWMSEKLINSPSHFRGRSIIWFRIFFRRWVGSKERNKCRDGSTRWVTWNSSAAVALLSNWNSLIFTLALSPTTLTNLKPISSCFLITWIVRQNSCLPVNLATGQQPTRAEFFFSSIQ